MRNLKANFFKASQKKETERFQAFVNKTGMPEGSE